MENMVIMEQKNIDALMEKIDRIYTAMIVNKNNLSSDVNGHISEDDAAKQLGRSKTWFWRKRIDGILPYKKLGSRVYYKKEDIFNLIENSN